MKDLLKSTGQALSGAREHPGSDLARVVLLVENTLLQQVSSRQSLYLIHINIAHQRHALQKASRIAVDALPVSASLQLQIHANTG